ncbi:hypothetical protein BJ170DRAFT_31777 [Xylariales sp. AK1849]|nr:hypothetical protein BJ170DRAFT_31777 [Xylariales sp. AK1849]
MSGLGPVGNAPDMTRGPALLAVTVTTVVVALSTCILRFCVKFRINRSVVLDDYCVGLAMLFGFIGTVFTIMESTSQETLGTAVQFDYLAQPWLNMGSTLSKVSICLLFLRLMSRVGAWKPVLGIQILLLLLVNLVYSLTILLQCRPMEKLWNSSVAGQCWSITTQHNIGYFQGAFDVFSELFIALFPIMVIRDLEIRRSVRWPLYALSMTSLAIAILAVVKTYNIALTNSNDQYMYQMISTTLEVLEQNLGILAANILPIASLFSNNIRAISQALGVAAGQREDSDMVSILSRGSKASKSTKASKRHSNGSAYFIGGPQRSSHDGHSSRYSEGIIEAWPMGIVKTVSVEVVEEDAADIERGMDMYKTGTRQDWDKHLR